MWVQRPSKFLEMPAPMEESLWQLLRIDVNDLWSVCRKRDRMSCGSCHKICGMKNSWRREISGETTLRIIWGEWFFAAVVLQFFPVQWAHISVSLSQFNFGVHHSNILKSIYAFFEKKIYFVCFFLYVEKRIYPPNCKSNVKDCVTCSKVEAKY